eukprot:361243-Chlamydomonas_euryale.AAC.2
MSRLVDAAASLTSADETRLQRILETLDVPERASEVLMLLKKEVELCKLQQDIREQSMRRSCNTGWMDGVDGVDGWMDGWMCGRGQTMVGAVPHAADGAP